MIPSPPELKPTIIQMQNVDNNDESAITDKPDLDQSDADKSKKKRRRSSSSLVSQNEIEKRRREHKTAHSIIEKKRRIRMNREFEALKFLVPACRNNLNTSNNNGEGMYKLTILQATVDYIKYLHDVINIQQDHLVARLPEWQQEMLDFAKVDVNTDDYRNLDNEFNFNQLFDEYNSQRSSISSELGNPNTAASSINMTRSSMGAVSSSAPMVPRSSYPNSRSNPRHNNTPTNQETSSSMRLRANSIQHSNDPLSTFQSLPSPIITPELYPRSTANPSSKSTSLDITNISNYKTQPFKQDFQFPLNPSSSKRSPSILATSTTSSTSTTPPSQTRAFDQLPIPALDQDASKLEAIQELAGVFETEESASKTLLSMKKDGSVTSIRSLLN